MCSIKMTDVILVEDMIKIFLAQDKDRTQDKYLGFLVNHNFKTSISKYCVFQLIPSEYSKIKTMKVRAVSDMLAKDDIFNYYIITVKDMNFNEYTITGFNSNLPPEYRNLYIGMYY